MRIPPTLAIVLLSCGCGGPSAPSPVSPAPPPVSSLTPTPTPEPGLEGVWKGVLGGALHLELSIRRDGDALGGVLDSIDQGSTLPIEGMALTSGVLHFEVASVEGSFEGRLDSAGRLDGTWTQHGARRPLTLVRDPSATSKKAEPTKKPLDAPIEVAVRYAPSPLRVDDRTELVYELHVTNFSRRAVSLTRLEILSDAGASMARFEGAELGAMCSHVGAADRAGDERRRIAPGGRVVVYVWLAAEAVPHTLDHRVTVQIDGDPEELTTSDTRVAVGASSGPVLGPPLRGGFWKAANGPSNQSHHRRALLPIGGRVTIAQRFAIDWVKIGDDGKSFSGDPTKNESYLAYGSEALAVADGVVTEVKDTIPENTPGATRAVPMTLETVAGNHVVVDLGGGLFGFWGHLQPGTLRVKKGDRVKRGQTLGFVGNSGNSTQPHLHFHVASSATSPLTAEGVPYAFSSFELRGVGQRVKQVPAEDEVVAFP
jgi:hypothetical protein